MSKLVEAQPEDRLPVLRELDLVLQVERRRCRRAVVVGIGRALAEGDRKGNRRIGQRRLTVVVVRTVV